MVFWAGNFIVVKGAIEVLPPVGFSFLRYCIAAVDAAGPPPRSRGRDPVPHGDVLKILALGVLGFGCYQILWPVALQSIPAGDSALLIAATPVMTALLAMAVGADTPNGVKLIGAFISFAGVALVIGAGQGLVLGASLDRRRADARRRRVLVDLHGLRRDDPAPPFAAHHHDLGDRRRGGLPGAGRHRPARDARTCPGSGRRSCSRSLYSGTLAAGSPTSSSSTA